MPPGNPARLSAVAPKPRFSSKALICIGFSEKFHEKACYPSQRLKRQRPMWDLRFTPQGGVSPYPPVANPRRSV